MSLVPPMPGSPSSSPSIIYHSHSHFYIFPESITWRPICSKTYQVNGLGSCTCRKNRGNGTEARLLDRWLGFGSCQQNHPCHPTESSNAIIRSPSPIGSHPGVRKYEFLDPRLSHTLALILSSSFSPASSGFASLPSSTTSPAGPFPGCCLNLASGISLSEIVGLGDEAFSV